MVEPVSTSHPGARAVRGAFWRVVFAWRMAATPACAPAGAGGGGARTPPPHREAGITLTPLEVEFSGPPARRYGRPPPHARSPIEAQIGHALDRRGMRGDPGLDRAARELARTSPDSIHVPSALVAAVMAWAGLVDPFPSLVGIELAEDPADCRRSPPCQGAVESLLAEVGVPAEAASLRYGVGVAPVATGATRMVVATLEPMVELEPMAVTVGPRGNVPVRGRLLGARTHPWLEMVAPSGRRTTVPASVSPDGSFTAGVRCAARGRHQVEVLANGAYGPEVAANFGIYCGAQPPTRVRVEVERVGASVDAHQLARANFEHLNRDRTRRGLEPLAWDDRAARVATAHSADMARSNFFGHVSPRTGDVTDRFHRAGIAGTVVRENVARGFGPKGVHDSLMASPGHRVNMMAEDVSHVGIGVVRGGPRGKAPSAPRNLYFTQNFFKPPGAGAPPDRLLGPAVRDRVDAVRSGQRLEPIRWQGALDAVALSLARRVAAGRRVPPGWEQDVFRLGYASAALHQVETMDFDRLAAVEVWLARRLRAGVGVVRRSDARGGGFVMVVLEVTR